MRWSILLCVLLGACAGSAVGAGDGAVDGAVPDTSTPMADASLDASAWPDSCVEQTVLDPGFMHEDIWNVTGGATVDVGADGCSGPGAAIITEEAWCDWASLWQSVVPCEDLTGTMLKVSVKSECEPHPMCLSTLDWPLALSINGASHSLRTDSGPEDTWDTFSFCLGERARSPNLRLAIATTFYDNHHDCGNPDAESWVLVDDLVVLPDVTGTCPPVGVLDNGDFESWDDGWQLSEYVEVQAGIGREGSAGLHLVGYDQGADRLVSFPLSSTLSSPAVELWVKGDERGTLSVGIGTGYSVVNLAGISASDVPEIHRVCVPRGLQGMVHKLRFSTGASYVKVIDDVRLVTESHCSDEQLLDGGFELTATLPQIHFGWSGSGYHEDSSEGRVVLDPLRARSGDAVGVLSVSKLCRIASLSTTYQMPEPLADAGPALKFWYRTSSLTNATFLGVTPATDTWTPRMSCLPPAAAGQMLRLKIQLTATFIGVNCGDPITEEYALVDDVEITTDPSCPVTSR